MTKKPELTRSGSYAVEYLRAKSLQLLDYPAIREELARNTTFHKSSKLAQAVKPSYSPLEVHTLLAETSEARYLLNVVGNLSLKGVENISDHVRRSDLGGILTGQELLAVSSSVDAMVALRHSILKHSNEITLLVHVANKIDDLSYLSHSITSKLGLNGLVLDTATPSLGILRRQVRDSYTRVTTALETIIRKNNLQGTIQDDVISVRGERLVVQVKSNMRSRVPGVVHDASNTGRTLFIEPFDTVNLCNSWRELVLEEEREVARVLKDLSTQTGSLSQELLSSINAASELDFILARGRYSNSIDSPDQAEISETGTLQIKTSVELASKQDLSLINAKHPLLGMDAVPLSIEVGTDWKVLVITGPNTGGKTVALKTVGLLAAMHQSGIHVPMELGSEIPIYDGIFADIGDQQSIEGSVSTFSSHIRTLKDIIDNSTALSLVLLDEIGSSTDPEEGAAIASAILEEFGESQTSTIATTHHQSVAALAETNPFMRNASFDLDPETLRPTYAISMGRPGRSYAMTVAARLGLPKTILEKAETKLSQEYRQTSLRLAQINQQREKILATSEKTKEAFNDINSQRNELRDQIKYILQRREEIVDSIKRDSLKKYGAIDELIKKAESVLSWSRYVSKHVEATDRVENEIKNLRDSLNEIQIPSAGYPNEGLATIKPGDIVYIEDLDLAGEVHRFNSGDREAEVRIGSVKITVETNRLSVDNDRKSNAPPKHEKHPNFKIGPKYRTAEITLDIRGQRTEPALERLDTFLDTAVRDGLSKVTIIHGKGTGTLRAAVRNSLKSHPLVANFDPELDQLGGDGATSVILN